MVEQPSRSNILPTTAARSTFFDLIAMLRHARVYVAVEYDEILGAVYFMRNFDNPDKVFLHSINIIDPQAYPNLGTSLLNIAFADMRAFGIRLVEVNVDPSNTVRSKFTGNSWGSLRATACRAKFWAVKKS